MPTQQDTALVEQEEIKRKLHMARVRILTVILARLNIPRGLKALLQGIYVRESVVHPYDDFNFCLMVQALSEQEKWPGRSSKDGWVKQGQEIIELVGYKNADEKLVLAMSAFPVFGYLYPTEEMPELHRRCGRF